MKLLSSGAAGGPAPDLAASEGGRRHHGRRREVKSSRQILYHGIFEDRGVENVKLQHPLSLDSGRLDPENFGLLLLNLSLR
ncbi:hypothetical protein AK812_SmicGene4295 [Symbiodinium microadriaticum]|uniref:Uncharacterized protein n=1 Tax=Symbiodinium microadriaticum TaxID=2951 RepID=A0A1Q9EWY5_SYMMI|nr:hypothetical protein AK812_SmicGene4295 [Symbiodinium microadriaticum]